MNSFNLTKTRINQKDIEKGQKIVAAVYLVTDHLPENDSIRISLRSLVTNILKGSFHTQNETQDQIEILLGAASLSGLISEKNSSIIVYEVKRFCEGISGQNYVPPIGDFFLSNETNENKQTDFIKDIKKTNFIESAKSKGQNSLTTSFTKNPLKKVTREDKILAFINDKKSAVIKDIISLFPDVSEKTVQRELSKLINAGLIIKRGSKRWSIYMAVNSLL